MFVEYISTLDDCQRWFFFLIQITGKNKMLEMITYYAYGVHSQQSKPYNSLKSHYAPSSNGEARGNFDVSYEQLKLPLYNKLICLHFH